jgi:hypothetical protein
MNTTSIEEQQAIDGMVRSMLNRKDDAAARRRLAGLTTRPAARAAQSAAVPGRQQHRQVAEAPDLLEQILWNDLVWQNVVLPERLREESQGFAGLAERDRNRRRAVDEIAGRDAAVMDYLLRGSG